MILTIDAGTTSCRSIIYSPIGKKVGQAQKEFRQIMPHPGWVEHDPMEIWEATFQTIQEVLVATGLTADQLSAISITNQRETTVLWDENGTPLYNAIVWQDKRTIDICNDIKKQGHLALIREKTGLVVDTYFSCSKIQWILKSTTTPHSQISFGTIDTWLIYKLTQGQNHVTDATNASRTGLYDIHKLQWDQELCDLYQIPRSILPQVIDHNSDFGMAKINGADIPISAVMGDQQSALYGQKCNEPGQAKNTYGTGCFMLQNTGSQSIIQDGLLTTIAHLKNNEPTYALEGSVFVGGSVIQWLRDQLGILSTSALSEEIAQGLPDNGGIYFVPAFSGLGSPHWNMNAKGMILGLTRATTNKQIIRAALESIAYQSADVLESMMSVSGTPLTSLKVDGGATANAWLMQFQADILQIPVHVPDDLESTARGVALMAAEKNGFSFETQDIASIYTPQISQNDRNELVEKWKKAVKICGYW